jgi:hypothetical protein
MYKYKPDKFSELHGVTFRVKDTNNFTEVLRLYFIYGYYKYLFHEYLMFYLLGILVLLYENHVFIVATQSHEYVSVIS